LYGCPNILIKGDCGRVNDVSQFFFCSKCNTVHSARPARGRRSPFYFNPQKIEVITQNTKRSYGKNLNEKVCPLCNIFIQENEFTFDKGQGNKVSIAYYKCRYCLWENLDFDTAFESRAFSKYTTELYKRHAGAREKDILGALNYIKSKSGWRTASRL
jgi:hypothetical protein